MSSNSSLESLQDLKTVKKQIVLPGGLPVYDMRDNTFLFYIPKSLSLDDLFLKESKATRGGIRLAQLAAFGMILKKTTKGIKVSFQYPKRQISLEAYTGILHPNQFVFEKPSELDTVTAATMNDFVLLVQREQKLEAGITKTIRAQFITESEESELSVLGLCIADPEQFQNANLEPGIYPPRSLRLDLPPHTVPSQHIGECASDTAQTELFFADGFLEIFAVKAEEIYKQFIFTNPRVLFDIDRPELVAAVADLFSMTNPSEHLESAQHILANMVRRYIFIRLLDLSTTKQIESLKISQTQCLVPQGVRNVPQFRARRPSINLYAGISIHERMIKIVGKQFQLDKNFKLQTAGYNVFSFFKIVCTILSSLAIPIPYTIFVSNRLDLYALPPLTVSAFAFFVDNTQGSDGHALSVFRREGRWHLQDNNLGVCKLIDHRFSIQSILEKRSQFFFCGFDHLKIQSKASLQKEGFFTEEELEDDRHLKALYYGFLVETAAGKLEQRIVHVEQNVASTDVSFFEGKYRVYFCFGTFPLETLQKALQVCRQGMESPVAKPVANVPTKPNLGKRFSLSEEILTQLQAPYNTPLRKSEKPSTTLPMAAMGAQFLEQFTGFSKEPPRERNPKNTPRKQINFSTLQNQFRGFSNTTDKGK